MICYVLQRVSGYQVHMIRNDYFWRELEKMCRGKEVCWIKNVSVYTYEVKMNNINNI